MKFLKNRILLALIGVFLGYSISYLLPNRELISIPSFVLLVFFILSILILTLVLVKIEDIVESNQKLSENINNGFTMSSIEDGMGNIMKLIPGSHHIRIIGTARQNAITLNSLTNKYLKQLEKRVSKKKPFVLKRITSTYLNSSYNQHLKKILDLGKVNEHEVGVMQISNIEIALTYVIVDDEYMVFNVYNSLAEKKRDTLLVFETKNKKNISNFINHFEKLSLKLKHDFVYDSDKLINE